MTALLEVRDLAVRYGGEVAALRGLSFTLERGEALAVVGESGSGKSTLALGLAGLVQPPEASGSVRLAGEELLGASPERLRRLRWSTVALALQGAPFNPVATVGAQIVEPLRVRAGAGRAEAAARSRELAGAVLLDPDLLDRYPHELSGGERRRASLAMALALDPPLVVLDEPTAGLDPETRGELVARIAALARQRGFALVAISHDLPDVAALAPRTLVLYAGEAMEAGPTAAVLGHPAHPYTWGLVNAFPVMSTTKDLRPIRGRPPDPRSVPGGCPFTPRCTQAEEVCRDEHADLRPVGARLVACHFGGLRDLLVARDLERSFTRGGAAVRALAGVSLTVRHGEAVGVVGRSGSGKSTLARIISGHLAPDAGSVEVAGQPLGPSWRAAAGRVRRQAQLVMQDPWDALSPRLRVEALLAEPVDLLGEGSAEDRHRAVADALDAVGLPATGPFLGARVHELSGGQLQRIVLARALLARPRLLVADEPTSMLDASEQARLLVVLRDEQVRRGLGLVYVSHDLAAVRKVVDRIVVLEGGRVVEDGPSRRVATAPRSPAARRLVAAAATLEGLEDLEDLEAGTGPTTAGPPATGWAGSPGPSGAP